VTAAPDGDTLSLLTPEDRTHELVSRWLRTWVVRPHPELGRPGAVCPFVAQALAVDTVAIAAYRFGGPTDLEGVARALSRGTDSFRGLVRDSDKADLVSLILAFPDLGPDRWHLIDEGHAASKTRFVEDGLMLGQFHPACEAPAAHNPGFAVNRAPLPLLVIRNMAAHDIMFLEQDPLWVQSYNAWLGRRGITLHHPSYRQRLEQALQGSAS
jgi:hypothetical protein